MKSILMLMCILSFVKVFSQVNYHDSWIDPITVCNDDPIVWNTFGEVKSLPLNEFQTCIQPLEDISQVWFRFKLTSHALISFRIIPQEDADDLDFVLFNSRDGVPQDVIRCMSTGLLLDRQTATQANCTGQTGLILGDPDFIELPGCQSGQNNFANAPSGGPGSEFMLMVTNYRSSRGFSLEWLNDIDMDIEFCQKGTDHLKVSLYPNPAKDIIFGNVRSPFHGLGQVFVVSSNGSILDKSTIDMVTGENSFQLPVGKLAEGIYHVFIASENGSTCFSSFQIVK